MKVQRIARVAISTAAAFGLAAGGVVAPASAASRATVVIVTSNALTGLNPSVSGFNLTFNTSVAYLQGMGFNYYDNKPALIDNKVFGTYKVVSQKPFRVKYTVNPGRVWSDGTPITGVDLAFCSTQGDDGLQHIKRGRVLVEMFQKKKRIIYAVQLLRKYAQSRC